MVTDITYIVTVLTIYVSKKNINIDQIETNFSISQLYFAKIHEYNFVKWFDNIFLIQVL